MRGKKERQQEPESKGNERQYNSFWPVVIHDCVLQPVNEIRGGQEKSNMFDGVGKRSEWNCGAGEKNKRQPKNLVQHLSLLHGIGDAGNHQSERAERDGSDGHQKKDGPQVSKVRHVEKCTCKEQFQNDCGKRQRVIREDAGNQHVCGGCGRNVKPAQDALLAEHDERSAQSPETAHHVQTKNRTEKIRDTVRLAFRKNTGVQEEKSQRHHKAEKEKHLVAQGELHAHTR